MSSLGKFVKSCFQAEDSGSSPSCFQAELSCFQDDDSGSGSGIQGRCLEEGSDWTD